tara:strand:- start:9087 stop:9437 length:351 start_codon:yes stop_codon:yes gene_type:complete
MRNFTKTLLCTTAAIIALTGVAVAGVADPNDDAVILPYVALDCTLVGEDTACQRQHGEGDAPEAPAPEAESEDPGEDDGEDQGEDPGDEGEAEDGDDGEAEGDSEGGEAEEGGSDE